MAKVQHTCTGCVPIDASIIDVYVTLVETNKSVTTAEASRSEAEAARVAAETLRTSTFATDHGRAVADHSIAQSDHATAGSDHTSTVAATNAANAAAAVANAKAALVQARLDTADADHTRAEGDHSTAASDHSTASSDHSTAQSDHTTAGADHTRAETDHSTAASDHTASGTATAAATAAATLATEKAALVQDKLDRADTDHTRAESDHTTAVSDHGIAGTDHTTATGDHTTASADHTLAGTDHTTAASDHTTAGSDHTLAASDHTTASADHTQALADHEVMAGYDTRLTNAETEVSQLQQEVTADISQLEAKVDDLSTGKYYGYYATTSDLPDDAIVDGFAYVGSGPTYTIYNCEGGVWTSSGITVNQSPIGNEEDIDQNEDGKLQFANRTYNSQQPNGMGYKILRKDATFASQVTDTNTIYEIRYDFAVNSAVTIPTGCSLFLNGGHISGTGTITLQSTKIYGNGSVLCPLAGTLNGEADIDNFGTADGEDAGTVINKVQDVAEHIVIPAKSYDFTTPAIVSGSKIIDWYGTLRYVGTATDVDAFTFSTGAGKLNMSGVLSCSAANISYSAPTNIRGLVIKNKSTCQITIGQVSNFNVNLVIFGEGTGCAYNTITLGRLFSANIGLLITQKDSNGNKGYANENTFIGGRFVNFDWNSSNESHAVVAEKIYNDDTYNTVNALLFSKTSVEGYGASPAFILKNATNIKINDCRSEGTDTVAKLYGDCKDVNVTVSYGTNVVDYSDLSDNQSNGAFMSDVDTNKKEVFDLDKQEQGEKVGGTKYYPFSLLPMSVSGGTEYYGTYNSTKNTVTKIGVEINFTSNSWNPVTIVLNNSDASRKNIYVTLKAELDGTSIAAANQQNYKVKFLGTSMSYNSSNYWASGANVSRQTILFPPGVGRVRIMMDNWQVATVIVPQSAWITHRKTFIRTGATADRPNQNFCFPGLTFFDTTLGKMIVNNGTTWVNMDGTAL